MQFKKKFSNTTYEIYTRISTVSSILIYFNFPSLVDFHSQMVIRIIAEFSQNSVIYPVYCIQGVSIVFFRQFDVKL